MARRPSLAALAAAVRVAEPGSTNLGELVADQAEELAPLLGVRTDWLRGRRDMLDDHLGPDLERLLRLRAERLREAAHHVAEERTLKAAARLATTATITDGRVELDAAVLLGELLADPAPRFVSLALDGVFAVAVHRAKLVEVARTLVRLDLTAWVDQHGLHLRWRRGRGGLDLYPQLVPFEQRDRVLHVLFPIPQQQPATPPRPRSTARAWWASAFADVI